MFNSTEKINGGIKCVSGKRVGIGNFCHWQHLSESCQPCFVSFMCSIPSRALRKQ